VAAPAQKKREREKKRVCLHLFSCKRPRGDATGARGAILAFLPDALEVRTKATRDGERGDVAEAPFESRLYSGSATSPTAPRRTPKSRFASLPPKSIKGTDGAGNGKKNEKNRNAIGPRFPHFRGDDAAARVPFGLLFRPPLWRAFYISGATWAQPAKNASSRAVALLC